MAPSLSGGVALAFHETVSGYRRETMPMPQGPTLWCPSVAACDATLARTRTLGASVAVLQEAAAA